MIWSEPLPSTPVYTYSKHCLRQFWEMNRKWIGRQYLFHDIIWKSLLTLKFENPLIDLSIFSLGAPRTICPVLQLCMGLFTLQDCKLIESRNCVFIFPTHLTISSNTEASSLLGVIQHLWMKVAVHQIKSLNKNLLFFWGGCQLY